MVSDKYPVGKGMEMDPLNSPGPAIFKLVPKIMSHSLKRESVQKGRTKSW